MTMTVRLYADRKDWPLKRIRTAVGHSRELDQAPRDRFDVRLAFEGDLDEEQRARMIEIAGKCPVHKALTEGARFTIMESPEAGAGRAAGSPCRGDGAGDGAQPLGSLRVIFRST